MTKPQSITQDHSEQYRAADPQFSVWVSAHAGSGKTHVLTDRVARLLLAGVPAERILCLTFTKAAAAEMANRLHARLGKWVLLPEKKLIEEISKLEGRPPDPDKLRFARRLFAHILEAAHGLRIQTIHAFCQSVLKQFPIEAGISPSFRVMDEHAAQNMMRQAQTTIIAAANHKTDPLKTIIGDMNDATFISIFNEIIENKKELTLILPEYDQKIKALAAQWELAPQDDYKNLRQKMITGRSKAPLHKAAMALQSSSSAQDVQRGGSIIKHIQADDPLALLDSYVDVFLTKQKTPRKKIISKICEKKNPGTETILLKEQQRIADLLEKASAARALKLAAAIAFMAKDFLKYFDLLKAEKGLLDYDDLITKTCQLFHSRPAADWVLYRLDGGLDHILIDEAQDTNPEQWLLIQSLTEEFFAGLGRDEHNRTLFAVGDPKQSIYSFQGVAQDGFAQMQKFFSQKTHDAQKNWQDISLTRSFRSTPEILHLIDQVFANPQIKMGEGADESDLTHIATSANKKGRVEIWPAFDDQESANNAEQLAQAIASKISSLVNDEDSPEKPGDILVLVQRRNVFVDHLMRALKSRSLPVAGSDRLQLGEHLAVMDLISLAKFVLLPEDDLSLAEILKSPLGGLSEDQLMALALDKNKHDQRSSLWAELSRQQNKYRQAFSFLSQALRRADFVPVFEFFSEILETQNMRARMAEELGADVHDVIDEFISLTLAYERTRTPSLQGFVHWIMNAKLEVKRDMDRGHDEIRIMTVHGAKGLEAKIVFLADLPPSQAARKWLPIPIGSDGEKAPFWQMSLMKTQSVQKIKDHLQNANRLEENRLLYVAMTRAASQLYVCGYHKKGESPLRWLPVIEAAGQSTPPPKIGADNITPIASRQTKQKLPPQPMPNWAKPSSASKKISKMEQKILNPSDFSRAEIPQVKKSFSLLAQSPQYNGAIAGSLMHEALRHAPNLDEKKLTPLLQQIFPEETEEKCRQTATQAHQLIAHADLAAYFKNGMTEIPLAALFDGKKSRLMLSGQIDRLILDEKKQSAQIIDYKTDKNPPALNADMPLHYQKQLAAYRAILQKTHPGWHIRAGLLWTRIPRLDWADENRLDNLAKAFIYSEEQK